MESTVAPTPAPAPRPAPQRWRWSGDAVFLGVSLAVVVLAALLTPSYEAVSLFGHEIPTLCGFRLLTGWPCPGCGLTRSFTFTAHGQLREAFAIHPLGPPGFAFVLAQIPWRIVRIARIVRRTPPVAQ